MPDEERSFSELGRRFHRCGGEPPPRPGQWGDVLVG
ncbi:hypothetical protein COCOBI_pt-1740 (chloroplast) [Coccomyxa sp. Obi]|nr:hypothetical protein COCOBI_pt-1740 [Coccomyxa sp. Obi]